MGKGGVQLGPFAGQQVGVNHLAQQGVTDVIAVLTGHGSQQSGGDRGPQRLDQLAVVQAGHSGQQPVGHLATGHRDHRQDLPGGLGQCVDPAAEQVT
jgi:hypothetical protein